MSASPTARVLLLGSSGMVFTDTGPSGMLPNLLREELAGREPRIRWECEAAEVPPGRDMQARVAAAIDRDDVVAVVLAISASYFAYDYVVARVRRRWPRLYPLARRLAGEVKLASGGGFAGGSSVRGALFNGPRYLASRVLGAEPYMRLDHVIPNTIASLDTIARRQGIVAVCKLPSMNQGLAEAEAARYRPRVDQFDREVGAACQDLGVFVYDLQAAMAEAGLMEVRVDDGLHADLATRRWDAGFLAGVIVDRLPGGELWPAC